MKKVVINSVIKRWDDNVPACLDSIVKQTFTNWILSIIVSVDSLPHIKKYLENKIGIIIKEKVIFQFDTMLEDNYSHYVSISNSGDYFFKLDGDDYLEPDCLEKLVKAIEETNSDIACCGVAMHDVKSGQIDTGRSVEKTTEFNCKDYSNEFPYYFQFYRTMWGKLYKSSLFTEDTFVDIPGGDERGGYAGDTMSALAILSRTDKFVIVEGIGYNYMIWGGSVSKKFMPNREKADPLLYQHLEKFLLSCDETISNRNRILLNLIHNNAIRDVIDVLFPCNLNINEKFDKFHYVLTNEVSINTIYKDSDNHLNALWRDFLEVLNAIKSEYFIKTENYDKQVCEIFSVLWRDARKLQRQYKKPLLEIISMVTENYLFYVIKVLAEVSPNCYLALTNETLTLFQNDNRLSKLLIDNDSNLLVNQLLNNLNNDERKNQIFIALKKLLGEDNLINNIDSVEFLLQYKKITKLLVTDNLEEVFNLMTDSIMSNEKIEFTDTYLNLYINLSKKLGIELGMLVGKLKLAQFMYDSDNFEESINISKELLQLGFQSDELDKLVEKLIEYANGNNNTKSENTELTKKIIPEMNIVRASGGLANQMYQYFFLRTMEERTNQLFVMDNLELLSRENPSHNGFELDKVFPNIKLKYVTDYLEQDVIDEIIQTKRKLKENQNIPDLLNEHGFNIKTLVWEQMSINREKQVQYNNFTGNEVNCCEKDGSNYKLISGQGGYYYIGVFPGQFFFDSVKEKVLQELQFPPITDPKNQCYYNHIKSSLSVGIHVRRGDFVNIGWDLPASKYIPAIEQVKQQVNGETIHPTFFIISDDIDWCKQNVKDFGLTDKDDVVFVEGNFGNQMNYIDLQFLANCKIVISNHNSSFSRVATFLNQDLIGQIRV